MNYGRLLSLLGGAALASLPSAPVWAQTVPNCNDTTQFPDPIVLDGSSAFEPVVKAIAVVASANGQGTIIYKTESSCNGVNNLYNGVAITGTASYYTLDANNKIVKNTCNLPTAGVVPDVAVSDVYFDTCRAGETLEGSGFKDFEGPVQAMLFVVPAGQSVPESISAEQAAAIYGCAAKSGVAPWTDPSFIFRRKPDSGTLNVLAKHIGVVPASWLGLEQSSSTNMYDALKNSTQKAKSIGILAADFYDTSRADLKALAFRGLKQNKAFFADSSATAFDKKNVRDGHYLPIGPVHMIAAVNGSGAPSKAAAKKLIDWVQGSAKPAPTFDHIRTEAKAGTVPQCAMKVQRSADGGYFSPYTPAQPCGCYFESIVTNTAPAACAACTTDANCTGAKKCAFGFCE